MKGIRRLWLVGVAAGWMVALPAAAWPARLDHVADGDTITVINAQTGQRVRVRLAGIDAPEVNHGRREPGQPFGQRSKAYLEQLLAGATIDVRPTGGRSYDRVVAHVLANGRDVGIALVRAGLAWDYRHYDKRGRYQSQQHYAKSHRLGVWSQPQPIPPWRWRHEVWH